MTLRQDLLDAIAQVQQHPLNSETDITTITGLLSETEMLEHLELNLARVARWAETGEQI